MSSSKYHVIMHKRNEVLKNHIFPLLLNQQNRKIENGYMIKSINNPNENKASMQINFSKNTYYDHGAVKEEDRFGDIIKFTMITEKFDFVQAVEFLYNLLTNNGLTSEANSSKLRVKASKFREYEIEIMKKYFLKNQKQGLPKMESFNCARIQMEIYKWECFNKVINHLYYKDLLSSENQDAIDYLMSNKRKLSLETIQGFPNYYFGDPDEIVKELKQKYTKTELIASGLFNEKLNFIFRYHRVLIFYKKNGKIVYMRGRNYPSDNRKAKYIGLFGFQSKHIFNFDNLSNLRKGQELYIMEGAYDVMLAAQSGLNAIGFPGVNNVPYEILEKLNLKQYKLFIVSDSDEAGDLFAEKFCQQLGVSAKRIKLQNGKDFTEAYDEK